MTARPEPSQKSRRRSLPFVLAGIVAGGGVLAWFGFAPEAVRQESPAVAPPMPAAPPTPPRAAPAPRAPTAAATSALPTAEAKAPSLKLGARNDISDDDLRFVLERIEGGDRELVVLYKEYVEMLKRADFETEVATVAKTESPALSKTGEILADMRARSADADLNQARNRLQQLIYHRRRNVP